MKFKDYMKEIESKIRNMNEDELKNWILNYLRQVPESGREKVLSSFSDDDNNNTETINKIAEWCNKIAEGEIYFSCHGYEDYSSGYWEADWVYEYEDSFEIGDELKKIYAFAEKCVYEKKYHDALAVFDNVNYLVFQSWDSDTEEINDITLEELVEEEIVILNLKKIALLMAYAAYMVSSKKERAELLYKYFSWNMFRDVSIENILEIGPEPVNDFEEFMDDWILLLSKAQESYSTRLLIEAIKFLKGEEGFLATAKNNPNTHPILYVYALKFLEKQNEFRRLLEEGLYAIKILDKELKIRGIVAKLTSIAANKLGKKKEAEECLWEAFYSDVSVINYLNLIRTSDDLEKYISSINSRIEYLKLKNCDNLSYRQNEELSKSSLDEYDYYTLCFFEQKFNIVYEVCLDKKNPLGWSTEYIKIGVPLFLILLYKNNLLKKAMTEIVHELELNIGINATEHEKNFWEYIISWKNLFELSQTEEDKYYNYIKKIIDERIIAIVSGSHRKSYYKAALLAAAWGEIEESRNKLNSKDNTIEYYRKAFPRHRSFLDELKKWK